MPLEHDTREMFEPRNNVFVDVTCRVFEADDRKLASEEKAIVFIPGWLMTAHDESVAPLCSALSKHANMRVFALSTEGADCRSEGREIDLLYEEAAGIAGFIREQGIKEVIIVGHSRGGNEAIDVVAILQKDSGIDIRGLILFNSAGLFEGDADALGLGLAASIPGEMSMSAMRGLTDPKVSEKQLRFGTDMAGNLTRQFLSFPFSYAARLRDEARVANYPNPRLLEIEIPVVVLFGKLDKVIPFPAERASAVALFPRARSVHVIEVDAGHMWALEEPAEAARRTLDALE